MASSAAAAVFAGGHSSRMGRDKNWLRRAPEGPTQLETVIAPLTDAAIPTWVVARPGQVLPPLPASCQRVDDRDSMGAGPLCALGDLLEALVETPPLPAWLLLIASDEQRLSAAVLRRRLAHLERLDATNWACLLVDAEGRRQPLASAVRPSMALERVRRHLDGGSRALLPLFDDSGVATASPADFGESEDADTPAQWAARPRS